jgi:hypothetical protein
VDAVAATIGDVAEFLDIDMHHGAGTILSVAADDPTDNAIQVHQASHPVTDQDPMDRRSRQAQQPGDARRSPSPDHRRLMMRRSTRAGVRCAPHPLRSTPYGLVVDHDRPSLYRH